MSGFDERRSSPEKWPFTEGGRGWLMDDSSRATVGLEAAVGPAFKNPAESLPAPRIAVNLEAEILGALRGLDDDLGRPVAVEVADPHDFRSGREIHLIH